MNKKKLALIIVATLLSMALVAVALIVWLIPGGSGDTQTPGQTNGAVTDNNGSEENNTGNGGGDTNQEGDVNEPTVGVDVEVPGETGGNTGNSGDSGNQGGNSEIDFDDLLGAN